MKRTESIQVRLPDGGRLHLRVSPEEKEMIRSKAEAERMTMSSLDLNTLDKIDNPISVNLDDSDLGQWLIEVRRINANVRALLKQVLDEYKRVRDLVSKIESMNREEAVEIAKKIKHEKLESVNDIDEHFE